MVRNHLDPRVRHVKTRDLTPAHVIDLKIEELDAGYSPRTVRYVLQTLGTALEQAVVLGMIPHNPTRSVKKPRRTKPKINPLRHEETDRFLAAARDDRLYPLYLLAVTDSAKNSAPYGCSRAWQNGEILHYPHAGQICVAVKGYAIRVATGSKNK